MGFSSSRMCSGIADHDAGMQLARLVPSFVRRSLILSSIILIIKEHGGTMGIKVCLCVFTGQFVTSSNYSFASISPAVIMRY